VLVPTHPLAAAEGLGDALLIREEGGDQVIRAEDVEGAVFLGERERLLVGEGVAVGG
jgi:hypothetical protein